MRLVCILITTLFFSVWIAAQQSEDDLQTNSSVSLNAFSDPEGIIDEVRSRLKQQKFREGIELLQILLEKTLTEASFAGKLYHRSENVYIPLDDFCVQLLREMPLGGYDTYITLYGATAERSLEQALSSGNTEGIETVSRLYPLTEAGQKALLYLADTALESGDGAKALYYLNRSIQTTGRRSTLTSLKMAAAMLIQTLKESAKEILLSLDDKTLSKEEAAIKAKLLEQTKGSTTTSSSRKQDIYNSFYDSSSSIAIPQDWRTVLFRGLEGGYWELRMDQKRPKPPRGNIPEEGVYAGDQFPIIVGNTVYAMDSQRVYALRSKGGATSARYPPDESSPPVNYGTPFAMETDGEILFAVLGSTKPIARTSEQPGGRVIIVGRTTQVGTFNNDLYSFDITLDANGRPKMKLLWSAKEVNQGINSLIFFTPPRLAEGQVLIGAVDISAEKNHTFLLCSFSRYGQLLFKTALGSLPQWSGSRGAVAYADGEAILLTNSGFIASVNIYTGRLEWAALYPLSRSSDKTPRGRGWPVIPTGDTNRQTVPPLLWKGVYKNKLRRALFLAPTDSELVMAYDLDARRLLWLEHREMHSFYLGFYKDLVIATGGRSTLDSSKRAIQAYHIMKGSRHLHFETDKTVAAKGILVGDELLLPCTTGLLRLALKPQEKDFIAEEKGFFNWRPTTTPAGRPGEPQIQEGCGNLLLLENRLITGYGVCLYSCELSQK